jgi:hypothetical protein
VKPWKKITREEEEGDIARPDSKIDDPKFKI